LISEQKKKKEVKKGRRGKKKHQGKKNVKWKEDMGHLRQLGALLPRVRGEGQKEKERAIMTKKNRKKKKKTRIYSQKKVKGRGGRKPAGGNKLSGLKEGKKGGQSWKNSPFFQKEKGTHN